MKRLLLGFIILEIFVSCNNGKIQSKFSEKTVDQVADSINKADSLNKIKVDSLSQIAWGEAKFGMSVKEVKNTSTFKKFWGYHNKNNPFQSLRLTSDVNIEGIYSIEASFFNDRLFRVDFESMEQSATYYDTDIKETVLRLKDLITQKYGEPTIDNGFPDFLEMKPDKAITAYSWEIGNKRIYIDVKEIYSGSEYKVECLIIHNKESEVVAKYNEKEKNSKKVNKF